MIIEFLEAVGNSFSREAYLVSTRIVSTLWTFADVVIVFYLIRIGNVFRKYQGLRLHRISYGILALTVPFSLMLPFVDSGIEFVRIEFAVTFPHFMLILYVLIANANIVARSFAEYASPKNVEGATPDTS